MSHHPERAYQIIGGRLPVPQVGADSLNVSLSVRYSRKGLSHIHTCPGSVIDLSHMALPELYPPWRPCWRRHLASAASRTARLRLRRRTPRPLTPPRGADAGGSRPPPPAAIASLRSGPVACHRRRRHPGASAVKTRSCSEWRPRPDQRSRAVNTTTRRRTGPRTSALRSTCRRRVHTRWRSCIHICRLPVHAVEQAA